VNGCTTIAFVRVQGMYEDHLYVEGRVALNIHFFLWEKESVCFAYNQFANRVADITINTG